MELEKLKELKERVFCLTTNLDAAIDDYFKPDNSGETKETERIHEYLNNAWDKMDAALDDLTWLIERQEKETEPAGDISKETFKNLLLNITPETLQAANKAAVFFREQLENEEANILPNSAFAALLSTLLVEYGKQVNKEEQDKAAKRLMEWHKRNGLDAVMIKPEPEQAADPEEEGSKIPW